MKCLYATIIWSNLLLSAADESSQKPAVRELQGKLLGVNNFRSEDRQLRTEYPLVLANGVPRSFNDKNRNGIASIDVLEDALLTAFSLGTLLDKKVTSKKVSLSGYYLSKLT